jgi:hypothetical protein
MRTRENRSAEAERRLRFAAEYVKSGVGSEAALAVGVSKAAARVTASRWLRRSDVLQEVERIRNTAIARIETRNRGAIADLAECLETLTRVQRTNLADVLGDHGEIDLAKLKALPAGVLKKLKIRSTTDAEGQVYAEHEIAVESAVAAAGQMIRHYDGLDKPQGPVNILNLNLPPHLLKEVGKALLSQGVIEGEVVKGDE